VIGYTIDSKTDTITWQVEEVAWGAFLPYTVVAASATLSIHRLQMENKWPGRYTIDTATTTLRLNASEGMIDIDAIRGDDH
jgi:hypothetical protein